MAATASHGKWNLAPHLTLIDEEIRKLVLREVPERVLVVRMPPRHGKSELVSHWTPVWHESNWPQRNVLFASYGETFATEWGRKARDSFKEVTALAPDILPGRLSVDRQAASNWGTTAGGYMATCGTGGPVTGKGFHLGICDDLIKNSEEAQSEVYRTKTWEWLTSTFWTRREPEGVMVVIGTPWHRDDYLARLREWSEPIREICLPAICDGDNDPIGREIGKALWPERFDEVALDGIRLAQGSYYWSALYQQQPKTHEHAEWPEEYFGRHIWTDSFRGPFDMSVMAIDPAKGASKKRGDYSAAVFVGLKGGKLWVDSWIERCSVTDLVSKSIAKFYIDWKPELLIVEGNAWQDLAIGGEMDKQCRESQLPPLPVHFEEHNKDGGQHKPRIAATVGPYLRRSQMIFSENAHNKLLVNQLKDYPLGDHDDGPDALEMALVGLHKLAEYKLGGETGDRAEQLNPV